MAQQPTYQQIAEDIRQRIDTGALARGAQLPAELELRDMYHASRNTVRDAIKWLIGRNLVETRPGQGTYVTTRIDPFVTVLSGDPQALGGGEGTMYPAEVNKTHRTASSSVPKVEVQVASAEVKQRLRVPPDAQVVIRHQERFIDGIPWSLQTSFYPMDFVAKGATRLLMAQDIAEGTVRYIAEAIGIRQTGYRDWITARSPDPDEQAFFGLGYDVTVFENFRTAFDQSGTPLRVTVTVFPTDRNQFIVNVGDVPDPEYA
jgi:GntR family transcriptional regulator